LVSVIILLFAITYTNFSDNCDALPCPTDIVPLNVPWTALPLTTVSVTYPDGTVCQFYVCYCSRTVGLTGPPIIEIYVRLFAPVDPSCPPSGYPLNGPLIARLVSEAILQQNPNGLNWPCPPCSENFYLEYRAYYGRCWDNGVQCSGNTYCEGVYSICCDENLNRVLTFIEKRMMGDNCESPCLGDCP